MDVTFELSSEALSLLLGYAGFGTKPSVAEVRAAIKCYDTSGSLLDTEDVQDDSVGSSRSLEFGGFVGDDTGDHQSVEVTFSP